MSWLDRVFRKGQVGEARRADRSLRPVSECRFRAGQVWTYRTRPGEEASRAVVGKVEQAAGHVIVHVQLNSLRLSNPDAEEGFSHLIGHLPVAEADVARSVVSLESEGREPEEFDEGYNMWREAYEAGKAGVFTATLAELVGFMEQTLGGGRRTRR